jgi:hypothetical protein
MPTITTTPYGTYTHGTPYRSRGAGYTPSYYRCDTWHALPQYDQSDDGTTDRFACTGLTDDSPYYHGPYDGDCAYCWLHHGHTQASHDHTLAQRVAAVAAHMQRAKDRIA